jgi:hypothetical protein
MKFERGRCELRHAGQKLAKMGAAMPEVGEKVDWLDPDDEDVFDDVEGEEQTDVELDVGGDPLFEL